MKVENVKLGRDKAENQEVCHVNAEEKKALSTALHHKGGKKGTQDLSLHYA